MKVKYFSLKMLLLSTGLALLSLNAYAQSMSDTITSTNLPMPTQVPTSNPLPAQGNRNMMPAPAPMPGNEGSSISRLPQSNRNMVMPMQQSTPPQKKVIVDDGGSLKMVAPSDQTNSQGFQQPGSMGRMSTDSTQQQPINAQAPNSPTQGH